MQIQPMANVICEFGMFIMKRALGLLIMVPTACQPDWILDYTQTAVRQGSPSDVHLFL